MKIVISVFLFLFSSVVFATPTTFVGCIGGADGRYGTHAIPQQFSICNHVAKLNKHVRVTNRAQYQETFYPRNDFTREKGYLDTSSSFVGFYVNPRLPAGYAKRYHAPVPGWRGIWNQVNLVWGDLGRYRYDQPSANLKYVIVSPVHDYLHANSFGRDPYKILPTKHPAVQAARRMQMTARMRQYENVLKHFVSHGVTPIVINTPPYPAYNLQVIQFGTEWLPWVIDANNYYPFLSRWWNTMGRRVPGVIHVGTGDWKTANVTGDGISWDGISPYRLYPSAQSAKTIAERVLQVIK